MEDKELQQLFEAKRTVEANRRRQEKLARMIQAESEKMKVGSRRLWPVWVLSAAACLALLLITLPMLFHSETVAPVQVAQTEVPSPEYTGAPEYPETSGDSGISGTSRVSSAPALSPMVEPVQEPIPFVEQPTFEVEPEPAIQPTDEPAVQPVAPAPRVLRRTSSLIACTEGCTVPEGTTEKADRNIEINLFANNNYADATIYSFEIKK